MKKKIIIYDFDGTLTTTSYPMYGIFEKCGLSGKDFLKLVNAYMEEHQVDSYRGYYESMVELLKKYGYSFTEDNICFGIGKVNYHPGVLDYFPKILDYCNLKKINLNNYVVTSGLEVFVRNTYIASYLEDVKGVTFNDSNFSYVTERKKVDKIREILDKNKMKDCRDVMYIGDGLTDFYALEYVREHGGVSILLQLIDSNLDESSLRHVVTSTVTADYREGSDLWEIIMNFLDE